MPSENPILGKPSPLLLIVISLLTLDYDLLSPKHICGLRYKKTSSVGLILDLSGWDVY